MFADFDAFAGALDAGVVPIGRDVLLTPPSFLRGDAGVARDSYQVRVHNGEMAKLLQAEYSQSDIDVLISKTRDIRHIHVVEHPWGAFINAASFDSQDEASATNYDAIWVRDSIWGYFALACEAGRERDAKAVLLTQLTYIASQAERMDRVIASPELLDVPEPMASMNAVHIRFNAQASDFADVTERGEAQPWTHKQNDALGLTIAACVTALRDGTITVEELVAPAPASKSATRPGIKDDADGASGFAPSHEAVSHPALDSRLAGMVRLVAYLHAVKFSEMEDSGAWEERPRRNTSSIGIVVSALEDLRDLLTGSGNERQSSRSQSHQCQSPQRSPLTRQDQESLVRGYDELVSALRLEGVADVRSISALIEKGNEVLHRQIRMGGESPDYPVKDARYRQADAALLSLIYPCRPQELGLNEELRILEMVGTLIGDFGIRRYLHDTYQSANFWWHDIRPDADPASHAKREAEFVDGTEAEWFFDSWYATCCLKVAKEMESRGMKASGQEHSVVPAPSVGSGGDETDTPRISGAEASPEVLRAAAVRHLNRALGQITGDGMFSADGKELAPNLLPESYNRIVVRHDSGEVLAWPVPSPIAPLNWAKASLTLCLQEFLQ